jgi:predicted ATPase
VIDDLASARVVTLTGVGGIGKTQLALEIGRHQQP